MKLLALPKSPVLVRLGSQAAAALSVLVVFAATVAACFQPLHMKRQIILQDELASRDLLQRGDALRSRYEATAAEVALSERRLGKILAKMPASADEAQFIHALSQLGAQHEVRLSKFSPGAGQELGDYRSLELQLNGDGAYEAVCRFLHALPQIERVSTIDRLQFSAANANGDQCAFEVSIHLLYGAPPAGGKSL
jgi:Tfp pilus assembly protein PilO